MTPIPPDFSTWSRENLERFAREAFAKLADQKLPGPPVVRGPLDCRGVPATNAAGKISR